MPHLYAESTWNVGPREDRGASCCAAITAAKGPRDSVVKCNHAFKGRHFMEQQSCTCALAFSALLREL